MNKFYKWVYWLPVFIVMGGVSLAFYSQNLLDKKNIVIIENAMKARSNTINSDILNSITVYEYALRGLRGAIETIGFEAFNYQKNVAYFNSRDYAVEYPGARGFGLIKKINKQELPTFLAQANAERNTPFILKQLSDPQDPLFIIQYIEPEIHNVQAVGLDIGSEINRRHAALVSAASRTTQLTAPITLVQADDQVKHGFLLLHPLFNSDVNSPSGELLGWTYAPLLINEILDAVLVSNNAFNIDIADITANENIHFYLSEHERNTEVEAYRTSNIIEVFGREWLISIVPTPTFINSLNLEDSTLIFWEIIVFVGLITLVITFFIKFIHQRLLEVKQRIAFSTVVNNAIDSIVGVDRNFAISHWNTAADQLFGFNRSKAKNKPLSTWLSNSVSSDKLIHLFKKVAKGEVIRNFDFKFKSENFNEERHISVNISPIFEKERFSGATISFNDITEITYLQDKLLKANRNLEQRVAESTKEIQRQLMFESSIIDSVNSAIIACDSSGVISLMNQTASTMFGYFMEEMTDNTNILTLLDTTSIKTKFMSDTLPENFYNVVRQESNSSKHVSINCRFKHKSGENINVVLVITPMWSGEELEGYVFIASDLSEKQHMQRHMNLVDAAIDNSQDVLLWLTPSGDIFNCNPHATSVLNMKYTELHQHNIVDIMTLKSSENWHDLLQLILSKGRLTFEADFKTSHNQLLPMLISVCVIFLDEERYIYLAAKNISERLAKEKEIELALFNADTANKAKTDFLANMSHELRTPINAISGSLQLLELSKINEIQHKQVSDAKLAMSSLAQIVDDILDITHLERDTLTLEEESFLLDDVLNEVGAYLYTMVGTRPIEIHYSVAMDVPNFLLGDRKKLQRILLNLGGNAVKFTQMGEVVIHISVKETTAEEGFKLDMVVRDTGIGIAEDQLDKIFTIFTQADNSSTRHYGGLGLGLTISSQYIKLMKGELRVNSSLGLGSEFLFDIAIKPATSIKPVNLLEKFDKKMNVLLVDDNATSLQILCDTVRQIGWNITATMVPEEAITLLNSAQQHNEPYDLVLLDWKMPNIDGWELAELIKKSSPIGNAPLLIMVTGQSKGMMAERYEKHPNLLNGFLTKPITRSQIIEAFLDALSASHHPYLDNEVSEQKPLLNMRILVVEDNPTNQNIAKSLLEGQGANVTIAPGGKQALYELENSILPFDLILMDIQMPEIDGYETTLRIRAIDKFKYLPIIAMTANVLVSDKEKCLAVGMDSHIGKPFDISHVVHQILTITNKDDQPNLGLSVKQPVTIPTEIDKYCREEGININEAMERFNFLTSVYTRSLNLFLSDLNEYISQLTSGKCTNQEMRFIFHTLKSTSGSLGFADLSRTAKTEESKNENWSNLAKFSQNQHKVVALLEHTKEQVKTLLEILHRNNNDEEISVIGDTEFIPVYNRLKTEINSFNMHAIDTYKEIAIQLKSLSPEVADKLIHSLNILKFKDAKELFNEFDKIIRKDD